MNTDYYKQKLEAEKALLENELGGIAVKSNDGSGDWNTVSAEDGVAVSKDDVADRLEDTNERKATEVPLEDQLQIVNEALVRLENGDFGKCEICGKEIEEGRLQANPSAKTCTEHME